MANKKKLGIDTEWIQVFGAREHNLKNIDVSIPKGKLTVITGPSGSGKSSLALDILFTEGKRRYVESLSSYARQFLGVSKKPEVDRIEGLCPAIAIEQKTVGSNPRSTVGTITEIYDHLRVLYARVGQMHCPDCGNSVTVQSPEAITNMLMDKFNGKKALLGAPIVTARKGEFVKELTRFFSLGYYRFVIDGKQHKFGSVDDIKMLHLKKTQEHSITILLDAMQVCKESDVAQRIQESLKKSFELTGGFCTVMVDETNYVVSSERICIPCRQSIPELEPRSFSFNSPIGACYECNGLGVVSSFWNPEDLVCPSCDGKRLNVYACAVTIGGKTIDELSRFSIAELDGFFKKIKFSSSEKKIIDNLCSEIVKRLSFLMNVGLSYLSLNRSASSLSGGEGQRIRLAHQIGSALTGVLYILDEPSIGLHQRDNDRLINTIKTLRDNGNTVVVVEHDTDTMHNADYIIDMGPSAGVNGGIVTAANDPQQLMGDKNSLTGAYLSGRRMISVPEQVRVAEQFFTVSKANTYNLKDLTVKFPLRVLCGISGVSGSGKSTLVMHELVESLRKEFVGRWRNTQRNNKKNDKKKKITGAESLASMVIIDQTPIGKTPRSNPATYLGIFNDIRSIFASLPESNARGYKVGQFSFNVSDGRCFDCSGDGEIKVEMQFLPTVTVTCTACDGKRYNTETLEIKFKGKSIADVLAMPVQEAVSFFAAHRAIAKRLQLLSDVGLDYLTLGQSSTTLSGGEAQRIKLVNELAKRGSDTVYILDEPTTGLHDSDVEKLLQVLNRLVDRGNSMFVIEHNLDFLKTVDYLIDLGPDGGDAGGMIVAQGTPREVAALNQGHTSRYLQKYF